MLIEKYDELRKLDEAIDALLHKMSETEPTDDEYAKMADQLTKLMKIKEIIGNLKIKSFDAETKKVDAQAVLELKGRELDQKRRESDQLIEHRLRELEAKIREGEDTYALKKREVDLKQQEADKPDRVSKETLATIAGNIAGIVLIIGYERVNIIATKALGFVMKSR